jgi:hypothetical protein
MDSGPRVEWKLSRDPDVPGGIRALVEARLLRLWRRLDCSSAVRDLNRNRCRSERFKMDQDQWSFRYVVDLMTGAVIVSDAVECAC